MRISEFEEEITSLRANLDKLEAQIEALDASLDAADQAHCRFLLDASDKLLDEVHILEQELYEAKEAVAMNEAAGDRAYGRWVQ
jgi:chromosome segregation ATPase